ncbi:hypothetical protein CDIK_2179 [Cucumispora dikerogammari]|nr:hypothetical protein CDIK_2179 [Cucumispora dikerogammari]
MLRIIVIHQKKSNNCKLVSANDRTNIICLMTIKNSVEISYKKKSLFDVDSFIDFINSNLVSHFAAHPNNILINDSCRFHHRTEIIGLLTQRNISHMFTTPYSTQLKLIEDFVFLKPELSPLMSSSVTRNAVKEKTIIISNKRTSTF